MMVPGGGRRPFKAIDARVLHFSGVDVGRTVGVHYVPHSAQCAPLRPHAMGLGTAGALLRHPLLLRLREGLSGRASLPHGPSLSAAVFESRFAALFWSGSANVPGLWS